MRFSTAFALAATFGVCALPAGAQSSFTPGAEVNGQINVQLYATFDDGAATYEPITNLALTLYRSATDSTQIQTDDAGAIRFAVVPGTYRIASTAPVTWHGRSYRWNLPLVVERGMKVVNLTPANAAVSAARGGHVAARSRGDSAARGETYVDGNAPMAPGYSRKDGATGVLFSFLLTGGGQFYAGKNTKGALLLGAALVSVAGAVSTANSCYYSCDTTAPTLYLLTGAGIWVYSMASAPGDAHEYNARHSAVAGMQPILDRRDGRTGIGLALKF